MSVVEARKPPKLEEEDRNLYRILMRNWFIRRRRAKRISSELTQKFQGKRVHEDEIITALWDHDDFYDDMSLDTHWDEDVDDGYNFGTVIRVEVH